MDTSTLNALAISSDVARPRSIFLWWMRLIKVSCAELFKVYEQGLRFEYM